MKTSEILVSARESVVRGWCQHDMHGAGGTVCIVGAVDEVQRLGETLQVAYSSEEPLDGLNEEPFDALKRHLPEFGRWDGRLDHFNDAETTTLQDVLNLFDKAICSLEERGE